MGSIFGILALLCLLGMVVCWIIVLIKLFRNAGPLLGILGFFCWIWTFIWGWMNAGKLNLRNIMLIWTALIILYVIFAMLSGGFSYSFGMPPAGNTP